MCGTRRYEARSQSRFAELVASDPYLSRHFTVPAVIPQLSGERVLATEWVPGVHIDKVRWVHVCHVCQVCMSRERECVCVCVCVRACLY